MRKICYSAFALGAVSVLGLASSAAAQDMDSRWLPYVGCWEAVGGEEEVGLLCFTPDGVGIELANIVDGEVVSTERFVGDGVQRDVSAEGCEGWESIQFSRDGRRAFTQTEFLCAEGEARSGTGVMTFMSPTMWSDIRTLDVGGEPFTWVQDYTLAGIDRLAEEGVDDPAADMRFGVRAARQSAAATIDLEDVEEASRMMDAKAVETWIVTQADALDPSGDDLIRLADAGVPENVIDAVVAVSHPDRFVVESSGEFEREGPRPTHYRGYMAFNPYWGPAWGLSAGYGYAPWRYGYGTGYYYGGRNSLGYNYGPYGYGYGYGYWGYRPGTIVIDRRSSGGRVVNGRGYSRGGDTGSGQARRRSGTGTPAYNTNAGSRGSTASGSSRGSQGRSSTGRRAVRRPSGGSAGGAAPASRVRRPSGGAASSSRPRRPSGGAASSSSTRRRPSGGAAASSSQSRPTSGQASRQSRPASTTPRAISRPSRPATTPSRPAARPSRPSAARSRPAARPSRPSGSSARPASRPARTSGARPAATTRRAPAARPSGSASRGSANRASNSRVRRGG